MMTTKRLSPIGRAILVTVTYPLPTLAAMALSAIFPALPSSFWSLFICLLVMIMIAGYLRYIDRRPLSVLRLSLHQGAVKGFGYALVLTAIIVCLAHGISWLLGQAIYEPSPPLSLATLANALMASFVLQGFPEELAFRAYLGQTLEKPPLQTLWWSAGLFSAIHLVHILMHGWLFGLQTVFYAFAFGVFAFVLQELFQTSWAAVAVHGGLHLTRFIWESQGIYSDSHYVYAGLLMLVISAFVVKQYYPKIFQHS